MAQCTRCRPGRPCLSHSFLPFAGHCWLELGHELLRKYPQRIIRQGPHALRDAAGRYFFSLRGLTFDEIPLGYLDWLAGQDWLYEGEFRKRLFAYLKHPCIQRELEALFPDEYDSRHIWCSSEERLHDKWHGCPMPKEEPEEPSGKLTITQAWDQIADFMSIDFDSPIDLGEALESMTTVTRAVQRLGRMLGHVLPRVRAKYRGLIKVCKRTRQKPVESPYYPAQQRLADYMKNAYTFNPKITRRTKKLLLKAGARA